MGDGMKISVIRATELGPSERARWEELQAGAPALASPCFSHEFTRAAAAVRPDVRIAVLEQDRQVVGFFPHQCRWGAGLPVGGRLSDHHGVVAAANTRWDWHALLKACGLSYWQFDHLAASQRPGVPVMQSGSHGLDLSRGYQAWWQAKLAAGSNLSQLPRKARKLEREVGPLRFEADCRDPAVFDTVIRLKSEQCRRTAQLDFFAWGWTRALVEQVRDTQAPRFAGRLSALYAGDTLVAAHFGMRSPGVWHWWFPVYSHAHQAYSPGALLLSRVAEAAASQGHGLLDLGKGDERYKLSFADCETPVVEGIVTRPTLLTWARGLKKGTGRWLRTSSLAQPLRPLLQRYRRYVDAVGACAAISVVAQGLDLAF